MAFTFSIGGVNLNPNAVWSNKHQYSKVRQDYMETLGGGVRVHADAVESGRPIHLDCNESGWLTKTMLDALEGMSEQAGGVFELVYGDMVVNVMFAHHNGAAVSFEPIAYNRDPKATDLYKGDIHLITV